MTIKAAISISYCADHSKGPCYKMDAGEHRQMLRGCINYWLREIDRNAPSAQIVVCANGCNKEEFERIGFPSLATSPINHGYAGGTLWAISEALKCAKAMGANLLVHTCEDVIPPRGTLANMLARMDADRLDYLGDRWRPDQPSPFELSTQFFGCRVAAFREFLADGDGFPPEQYMGQYVGSCVRYAVQLATYRHTHTYQDWERWMGEEMAKS